MQRYGILDAKAVGTPERYSLEEELRMMKRVGFGAFFTAWDADRVPAFAKAAERNGMLYASIHAVGCSQPVWGGGEEGDRVIDSLILQAEGCARYGVPILVVHPSAGFDLPEPTEIGLEAFGRLIRAAEHLGVTVAFENLESDQHLDAVLRAFEDSPACGYCYDTGHALAYSDGKNFALTYADRLCHTHLHDNFGRRGTEYTSVDDLHLLPGDGLVDWKSVMRSLTAASYTGVLMSEVKYPAQPGTFLYDTYGAPSLEAFYTLVYERLNRLACGEVPILKQTI